MKYRYLDMIHDAEAKGPLAVVQAPRSPDRSARTLAAVAVLVGLLFAGHASGQDTRTLTDWQRDLRHPSADVRVGAALALGAFDRHAVAALTEALGDSEHKVRAAAALALVKIGPAPVVPGMIDALRDPRVTVRANAAVVLGAFGPAGKSAAPALVGALNDTNARVRELAIEALNRVESTGPIPIGGFPLNCH